MAVLSKTHGWYLDEKPTYICIYVAINSRHILPMHVPNILVIKRITHQMEFHGSNDHLALEKINYDLNILFILDSTHIFNKFGEILLGGLHHR